MRATAVINEHIERVVVEQEESVVVTMSKASAQALTDILSSVGGPPKSTDRGHTDQVYFALNEAGFKFRTGNHEGSLYFTGRTS